MVTSLNWIDIRDAFPEVDRQCLCYTSNGKYFISNMYHPHDGYGNITDYGRRKWKGSSRTTESITHWAYLEL